MGREGRGEGGEREGERERGGERGRGKERGKEGERGGEERRERKRRREGGEGVGREKREGVVIEMEGRRKGGRGEEDY